MVMFKKKFGYDGADIHSFCGNNNLFSFVFAHCCIDACSVLSSKYLRIEKTSEVHHSKPVAIFDKIMGRFFTWLDDVYAKGVSFCLKHKKIIISVVLIMFVGAILLIKMIGFTFMPTQPATSVTVNVEMPKGTTVEATREIAQQLEANISKELKRR